MVVVSLSSMAFIVYVLLGIYSYILNKKSILNKLFSIYCSCFAVWSLSSIFINAIENNKLVLYRIIDKAGAIGWCTFYGLNLHLTLILTGHLGLLRKKLNVIFIYAPGIIMLMIDVLLIHPEFKFYFILSYYFTYADFFCSVSYISVSIFMIWLWGRKSKISKEKKQSKIIVFTGLASYWIGLFMQDALPLFHVKPLYIANVVSLIFACGVFYGIINHELLKISAANAAEYIVSKVRDIVILLDSNEKIIYGNPQVLINLGYYEEELSGKHYSVIFKNAFEFKSEKHETYCIAKDNTEIPVYVTSTEIHDKTGDHIGTVLVIKNITETIELSREKGERELAQASLRNLLNNVEQGFLTFGKDLIINKTYSAVCETIFDQNLADKTFPYLLHPDRKKAREFITNMFKVIFNENDKNRLESNLKLLPSLININKKYIKLEYKIVDEAFDKKIMVILTDITKEVSLKNQMEDILLKNEISYNLLIQNSRDAIFVHDECQLLFGNESSASLLGFVDAEDLKRIAVTDLLPMDIRSFIQQKFALSRERKSNILSFYGKVLRSDGKIIDVENISTYVIYRGKPTILSILRDITPEKQVEELKKDVEKNIKLLNETKEYNKLITEFFSNVSHELKTPLNVIYAAVQTLTVYRDNLCDKDRCYKYLSMMKRNCYRLTKLINNLLDSTKLDSGFLKLELTNLNIVNLVEEITLSIVTYAEANSVNIIFDTDVEEKFMACDPDKIERIILNIISNSIKFTNPGGDIYVNIMTCDDNVIISIRDTGVGIPEENLETIFERFGQVDKTLRRNHEGCGIGLSLVKSLVKLHGGDITVKSKLYEGSEFLVKLPVVLLDTTETVEPVYKINMEKVKIELSDINIYS